MATGVSPNTSVYRDVEQASRTAHVTRRFLLPALVVASAFACSAAPSRNPMSHARGTRAALDGDDHAKHRCPFHAYGAFGPWSEPTIVDNVNSPDDDFHPAISPDGLSLYISSSRSGSLAPDATCLELFSQFPQTSGQCNADLWVAHRTSRDAAFGAPVQVAILSTHWNEIAPDLSPDGHSIYWSSTAPGSLGTTGAPDIWFSHRDDANDDFAWGEPMTLGGDINTATDENAPTLQTDEDGRITKIYFNSIGRNLDALAAGAGVPPGAGDFDIYVSDASDGDTFGSGVLDPGLSSPQRDTRVALRRDGLEMFITSNRVGSAVNPVTGKRSNDLWVATRETVGDPWSAPVNLGSTVNSTADDGGPALSCDGTTLYFFSTRPGGPGKRDLYVATRAALEDDTSESEVE